MQKSSIIICISLIILTNCGKKQNDIFSFQTQTKTVKINKLSFPAIKQVKVHKTSTGNNIFWEHITKKTNNAYLHGYNIYKFTQKSFIPKKPINNIAIQKNSYLDTTTLDPIICKKQHKVCYLVRALFNVNGKIIEGPSSQIMYLPN